MSQISMLTCKSALENFGDYALIQPDQLVILRNSTQEHAETRTSFYETGDAARKTAEEIEAYLETLML